jgi:diguanylate cyclase (GGDEF)-like protein
MGLSGRRPDVARSQRPPRLVLRFAIITALGLAVAAGAILAVVRHGDTVQAERNAISRARFATEAVLTRALRAEDLAAPVSGRRRAQLDAAFSGILLDGTLRATLYTHAGRAVYSTDHRLIGTTMPEQRVLREAIDGTLVSHVRPARGSEPRVLETFVRLVVGRNGNRGAVAIEQDYAPIEAAAHHAFIPIAVVLEALLALLFVVLVPLLARTSARIRRHVAELEHVATHDELTRLPNRIGFRRATRGYLSAAANEDPFAVVTVDLVGFRAVNEALGNAGGDALLRQTAERLLEAAPDAAFVARIGADEFAVVASAGGPEAVELAGRLRRALARPLLVDGAKIALDGRIGVALAPDHGMDPEALLRCASVATELARERRTGVEVYDPADDAGDVATVALAAELREGIEAGQLVVHYQPQLDVATGAIRGLEALVRWQHPERGLLAPGAFVPLAERSGRVKEISRVVLAGATRQWSTWNARGLTLDLAVNLSAADLFDLGLPDEVAGLLARHRMPAERLTLELTESTLMGDEQRTAEVLERLRSLGVRLSIDDFGTGYSSLAYLERLPVHEVKVDRTFVAGIPADDAHTAIVKWTVTLAHTLGFAVVAEGVETPEQLAELGRLGCDVAQGYLIGRPLPSSEVAGYVAQRRRLDAAA